MSPCTILNFYFAKFQQLLQFGILFGGGGGGGANEDNSNKKIFRIQKRVVRSMIGVNLRTSFKQLFLLLLFLQADGLFIPVHLSIFSSVGLSFSSLQGFCHVLSLLVARLPSLICVRSIQFFSFVPTMLCFGSHMIPVSCRFSFYPTLFYL